MSTGAELIAAERQRQIDVEGWTPEHDCELEINQLAYAAVSYATPAVERRMIRDPNQDDCDDDIPDTWPWLARYWKPTPDDRVRELVKAGALIAAEIDRLVAGQEAGT